MASGGVEIWVSADSCQKNDIGWPQQPQAEKIILQKGTVIGHLYDRNDQTIIDPSTPQSWFTYVSSLWDTLY